jgi:hypothetical protein
MEKQTIFRKVSVTDRLPEKEGIYVVKNDQSYFEAIFDHNYSFHGEFTDCSGVTHWLEEIELPTEEETTDYVNKNFPNNKTFVCYGIMYILNKLKS